jgi:tetratricopeptide (TPR) repeat protein
MEYARTELNVIARYVSLAFWPRDLALDYYDWPIARHWGDVTAWGWMVLAGAIVCLAAVKYKPWLGFLGVWCMAILAPTSSFLPIAEEAAAEQRMYLPLVAIVALVVVGGWVLVSRWKAGRWVMGFAIISSIIALCWMTRSRNEVYGSEIDLWTDTIAKRPNNTRAHVNLGEAYAQASIEFPPGSAEAVGAAREAAEQFRIVIALEPRVTHAIFALGESLEHMGDAGAAEALYTEQLPLHPEVAADLYVERGTLRAQRGDWGEAKADFGAAIERKPGDVEAHYFLGVVCQQIGDLAGAKRELQKVVQNSPDFKDAAKRLRELEREK